MRLAQPNIISIECMIEVAALGWILRSKFKTDMKCERRGMCVDKVVLRSREGRGEMIRL